MPQLPKMQLVLGLGLEAVSFSTVESGVLSSSVGTWAAATPKSTLGSARGAKV